ncbi:MAG TPA: ABC transporter substrate-binding protein [Sphingomonas sp.]|jgi:iron complex transport system substrate-binding protein
MRLLPLLLLAGCASPPSGGGGGIVSTNPCADAMLVQMVPHARIAAISHYSHDPGASSIPPALARRFRTTAGTAEEVIALRPDLVVASTFTPPATRDAYARAGLRTLYLDSPQTVAASIAQVTALAFAVDAPAKGEAMASAIAHAAAPGIQPRDRPAALLYIAGDLATGSGTLLDELLTRAGFRNAAADYGLAFTGTLPAETIVSRPPSVVIAPAGEGRRAALRRKLLPATREADFPRALVNCGGPTIIAGMARLRAIRATL